MQEQCTGTVAVCLLHAPPSLAARGFTRRRWKTWKTGVPGASSSLLPCRRWPALTAKSQQPVDFKFSFLCFSGSALVFLLRPVPFLCLLPSLFGSLLPMEALTATVVRGCWSCGEDGGGCPVSGERRNGVCGWRGRPWVCGCLCWRRAAADRLKEMTKSVAPALPCVGCCSLPMTALLAPWWGRRCCCRLFSWLRCVEESSCWAARLREEGDDGEVRERPVEVLWKWFWGRVAGAGNGKGMADDSEDSSDAPFCWLGVWPAKEKDELKGRPPAERRREEKIKGRGGGCLGCRRGKNVQPIGFFGCLL